jgi:hypothetical protein
MYSFDIAFLGLIDPSPAGRSKFVVAMERLTGKSTADCQEALSRVGQTLFNSLPVEQARMIANALEEVGAVYEIRPMEGAPQSVDTGLDGEMHACPSCGFVQHAGAEECSRCGVIFSKMDRDVVRGMQRDQALEEAQARAEQIRQEWDDRAKQHAAIHPVSEADCEPFSSVLSRQEIPFLRLNSLEGPLLLTSRQILANVDGEFVFLPFEFIKDVDYGGGLVPKKGYTRLVLRFHSQFRFKDKNVNSITWQLDAKSATNKEVIMDWAFARSYMCGSCGARELDFRNEKGKLRARCMRCATDHDIDLRNHEITAI